MAPIDIVPSSDQGQALQAAIQGELVGRGWTSEDDQVMAEYCLVMLGNHKNADQIAAELSDLIPGEFEPSFLTWLFTELDRHYPDPDKPQPQPQPQPNLSSTATPFTPSLEVRGAAAGAAPAAPPSGVFGTAVTGVKRGRDGPAGQAGPAAQRQRFDGQQPPSGPRSMNGVPSGPRSGPQGGRSLLDRVGPAPPGAGGGNQRPFGGPGGPAGGMPPQMFEMIAQAIAAVVSGAAPPMALSQIPFPALASHPHSSRLPPQVMQQAQAAAMAQAQAMVAMQNAWGGAPQQPGFGFNGPQGGPQGFGGPGRGGFNGGAGGRGGFKGPNGAHHGGGFGNGGPGQAHAPKPAAPPAPLPTEPKDQQICKHNVSCTKPQCPFSHSSAVATKESGLVLSSEHCKKGLACDDPDCSLSHVSPAQKRPPPASDAAAASASALGPGSTAPSDATAIAGAGEKQCKFGAACTRKGCVFLHPWDQRDGLGATGGSVPCRWALACTRVGCHFSHPPGRRDPAHKTFQPHPHQPQPTYDARKFSATFNKPGQAAAATAKPAGAIGAWPSEGREHVSERLKRFAVEEGEGEKIIPGGGAGGGEDTGMEDASVVVEVDRNQ